MPLAIVQAMPVVLRRRNATINAENRHIPAPEPDSADLIRIVGGIVIQVNECIGRLMVVENQILSLVVSDLKNTSKVKLGPLKALP